MYIVNEIEQKWQEKWGSVFEADIDESKPKFFVTFPYPYLNGDLHLGHGFTATRIDVFARYKRMRGYNVLFPFAFHATGEPIVGLAKRVKEGDEKQITTLKLMGIPEHEIRNFEDPKYVVEYFRNKAEETARMMGFSVDWRRKFTTIDREYNRFIEWQYWTLKEKGYIKKGTHPVIWCPKCESPTGDHDRLEGEGVTYTKMVILKFRKNDKILPCATLRPETIFGVTNLWIHPEIEYVIAEVDGKKWILSKEAAKKLKNQLKNVEIIGTIKGRELVGKYAENPITGEKVIILPAEFVDPDFGTGIVMSVPAHAPYDYIALKDLENTEYRELVKNIKPISIIKSEGFGEYPTIEVCKNITSQEETEKLEEATKTVYKKEFHTGVLKENCGKYAGKKVSEVKDKIIDDFVNQGIADIMYETEDVVICRCKTKCIVKILTDQWFLNYSNPEWKNKAKECLNSMKIYPEEARAAFEYTIEWLEDKACARKSGLGTRLPWDKEWIVETLSDSTIYMALYTIAHKIMNKIPPEKLDKSVFDYIFLGKNSEKAEKFLSKETLEDLRKEFLYWYPVDFRNSAEELIYNHLTFFIFHHTAIFPRELWPRSIGVNGMVMVEGEKMSKSKGNFIVLKDIINKFGADVVRLTLMYSAERMENPDWREENTIAMKHRLERFLELAEEYRNAADETTILDRYLISKTQKHIKKVLECYENTLFRSVIQTWIDLMNDIKEYKNRGGNGYEFKEAYETLIKIIAPIAPHHAEEAWERIGKKEFVSLMQFPEPDQNKIDRILEKQFAFVKNVEEDICELEKRFGKAKKIKVIVASEKKREILKNLPENIREVPRYIYPKLGKNWFSDYIVKHAPEIDREPLTQEQEIEILKTLKPEYEVEREEESKEEKASRAIPGKPAIILEFEE